MNGGDNISTPSWMAGSSQPRSGQAPYTIENPCLFSQLEGSWEEQVLPQAAVEAAPGCFISFFRVPKGWRRGEKAPCLEAPGRASYTTKWAFCFA